MSLNITTFVMTLSCILATQVHAASCRLENIPVTPLKPGQYETFHAKAKSLELRFHSDANDPEVDAFPEPPLQVLQLASNTQCEVDGGIWVRKDIYLTQDEQVLVTHEYSGSNDFLMFYKTADCTKLHELDVTASRWKIAGNTISVQSMEKQKKGQQTKQYVLDASCKPVVKSGQQ
ncbi:hypothetical protein UNDKW_5798 [Undibacterium sp. KW1]|uniref:hypothetical protein n=1 Tax=Undibacterium sp. KW1 TaxID=2058624 RepID=UPI001331DAF1|nr:hypothetical protein [Undibacterium sp. KW1]BBB64071.1 hypothetical protein UNDKW_5798 [Undibacterium sp. KW1]